MAFNKSSIIIYIKVSVSQNNQNIRNNHDKSHAFLVFQVLITWGKAHIAKNTAPIHHMY
jgi:hypothetical protein